MRPAGNGLHAELLLAVRTGGEVGMIQIDIKMPKCCDECFALDDYGDYPFCLISQDQRGYTFNTKEKRMPTCPLKAQEPRVLTLEEALIAEFMYYEQRYVHHGVTNGLFPVIRKVDRFCDRVEWYSPYFPDGKVHCLFTPDEYGVFSRCWTSRPTDAQREAEPWQ